MARKELTMTLISCKHCPLAEVKSNRAKKHGEYLGCELRALRDAIRPNATVFEAHAEAQRHLLPTTEMQYLTTPDTPNYATPSFWVECSGNPLNKNGDYVGRLIITGKAFRKAN
ncbi:MAG: hypothetical protein U0525_05900 [Patescibacteria group bacterium]